jgi:hypothetical protein
LGKLFRGYQQILMAVNVDKRIPGAIWMMLRED